MSSPTQRSLANLRKRGYLAAVTEHWNTHIGRRQDLFGFVDILACGNGHVLAVQTTTLHNLRAHMAKINSRELRKNVIAVTAAGIRIVVHGWTKRGARWHLREVELTRGRHEADRRAAPRRRAHPQPAR